MQVHKSRQPKSEDDLCNRFASPRSRPKWVSKALISVASLRGEGAGELFPPAGLAVALEHPEVATVLAGGVDKALSIRLKAEANSGVKVSRGYKFFAQFLDDLLLQRYRVEREQRGAVPIGFGFAGLDAVEHSPVLGEREV